MATYKKIGDTINVKGNGHNVTRKCVIVNNEISQSNCIKVRFGAGEVIPMNLRWVVTSTSNDGNYSFTMRNVLDQIDVEKVHADLSGDYPIARLDVVNHKTGETDVLVVIQENVLAKAELLDIPVIPYMVSMGEPGSVIFKLNNLKFSYVVDWVSMVQRTEWDVSMKQNRDVTVTLVQGK